MNGLYPEHEKLQKVKHESEAIGQFLDDFLLRQYELATWGGVDGERLVPERVDIETLLARYFGIDRNALEKEKRHMLENLRQATP